MQESPCQHRWEPQGHSYLKLVVTCLACTSSLVAQCPLPWRLWWERRWLFLFWACQPVHASWQTASPECKSLNTSGRGCRREQTFACMSFQANQGWLLQIVIAVMHLGRYAVGSETLSVLVSFQILLLWVKIQYFARQAASVWGMQSCIGLFTDNLLFVVVKLVAWQVFSALCFWTTV